MFSRAYSYDGYVLGVHRLVSLTQRQAFFDPKELHGLEMLIRLYSTLAIWEWSPCRTDKGGPVLPGH